MLGRDRRTATENFCAGVNLARKTPARFAAAFVMSVTLLAGAASAAQPESCPGNPDALGTSRTLSVDPAQLPRLGVMQYRATLPLADHEVVLTFDDGPLPPRTDDVLQILAHECVKATFFMVGRQANAFPEVARRVFDAGHTIGTHSQNHSLHFHRIGENRAEQEVEAGIVSVQAALGADRPLAPFFRIPGLNRTAPIEAYLKSHNLMVWSADTNGDDWRRINANQVLERSLRRLAKLGRGVLLFHDIQPRTVQMLPVLLRQLKARGYSIVHVVPSASSSEPVVTASIDERKQDDRPRFASPLALPRVAAAGEDAAIPMPRPMPSLAAPVAVPETELVRAIKAQPQHVRHNHRYRMAHHVSRKKHASSADGAAATEPFSGVASVNAY
jgi:peptidoglycan/xylan/chitin deacetylase (PgdA/CDA1 family)